jgi:uncharacterized protein YkwD
MRKPLVVVCTAASALLLAGGVAATTAGADERPSSSGWGGWVMPSLPGFGGFGGFGDSGFAAHDGTGDNTAWQRPAAEQPAAQRPAQQRPAQQRPAQQRPAAQRPAAQRPAQQQPVQQRPVQQRPVRQADAQDAARPNGAAHVRQRPAQQRPGLRRPAAAQRNGASLMAAARQAVTAADVSSSPYAPVQQQVLALVNDNRRRGGCGGLSVDRRLIDAANEHAADMARRDYFAHESPNGEGAGERVKEAGYRWKRYGENIARGADSAYEVVDGWMNSPSHRRNILDCRLHQMGIGLALDGDRTTYWVQDFATPRS